jgi:hypothetical protein
MGYAKVIHEKRERNKKEIEKKWTSVRDLK